MAMRIPMWQMNGEVLHVEVMPEMRVAETRRDGTRTERFRSAYSTERIGPESGRPCLCSFSVLKHETEMIRCCWMCFLPCSFQYSLKVPMKDIGTVQYCMLYIAAA